MKSTAACVAMGLGLLFGCSGGVGGPRDIPAENTAGATPVATAGSTAVIPTTGGSPGVAGGSAGGTASTVAGAGAVTTGGSGGSVSPGKPCGAAWMAGAMYAAGDIVQFMGSYYQASHENPGYDPTISTYFWDPYTCSTDGGGTGGSGAGGSGPLGDSAFDDLVSEQLFNQMFPDRNKFYTYQGLVDATRKYPTFAATGTADQKQREVAAFLANVARETGELIYIEQIAKDVYCSSSAACPCEAGKQYYGRGPIQISWNYNYCLAGKALGYDLRAQPELVSQNATVAWATGLWFWMTQRGAGSFTAHEAITADHGFGETIRTINGDVECNGGSAEGVNSRVDFYQKFCQILGVDPGTNLTC
jgi:predicted chitinase